MRLLRTTPLLLAAAALALAQTPPSADEKPASVSGTVTNSLTGEPILRAHVSLRRTGQNQQVSYGALTNGEGKFTVGPVPPGDYQMVVERVAFFAPMNPSGRNGLVKLAAGDRKDGLKLTLTPAGSLTGRVLNADGEPVAGSTVFAERAGETKVVNSDEKGQFRVGGLRAGRYRVKATPRSLPFPVESEENGNRDSHDSTTYYPSSLTETGGQRLEVKPGVELSGLDIRLARTPSIKISGRITGVPPEAKNVRVQLMRGAGIASVGSAGTTAKPDRTFEVRNVEPGKYTITVYCYSVPDPQSMLRSAPVEIEVAGGDLANVELQIVPPFAVQGQLRFEDEQARQITPRPTRPGQPAPPPQPRQLQFRSVSNDGFPPAEIRADDTFAIESMQPGLYHVSLQGGSGYVKSVRAGMTETEGDLLDLRAGSPGPVTVTLSSNTCDISGIVTDLKGPVEGAIVALIPLTDTAFASQRAFTDSSGAFRISRVVPGKYRLVSLDDEDANLMGRRDTSLEDYESVIENLDLHPGDKVVKDLRRK